MFLLLHPIVPSSTEDDTRRRRAFYLWQPFWTGPRRAAKLVSLGAFCLCQQPSFCVFAVIYYVKEGWLQGWWRRQRWGCGVLGAGWGGDTDLPLINADGDQGERQDDEDWSSHINHPSSGLLSVCVSVRVCVRACVFVRACACVLPSFLTEITLRFTG